MTVEPSPALLGGLGQLEDHGERGLVRQAALRAHRAMADRHERALHWVRGPSVLPVLGGEVVEGEQRVAVLHEARDRLVVLDTPPRYAASPPHAVTNFRAYL